MLPSLYVAASMPDFVETKILDEDVEPVDFNTEADIVGFSFMTYNAPRAYELADSFRKLGKTVIFGGYHPSFMPDEAIRHADSICIGEAESNVPKMIQDFLNGNLQQFYKNDLFDLSQLPEINRSLIQNRNCLTTNALPATRGCVHHCDFSSVGSFHRYKIRTRPVGNVIDEIKTLGKHVLFMDDNIALNNEYAKELFSALIPLKKRWYSQCGMNITDDEELLDLASKSGCRGLFVGFESLSQQSLANYNKHSNRKHDYMEVVKKLHDKKIGIFAGFVFGCDEDGPDVFENTLDFLLDANIESLQSTRLTPFPGTPLFEKLDKEERIIDKDWSHYDFFHVVFEPKKMTREMLHAGTAWIQQQFYSSKNILRRIRRTFGYLHPDLIARAVIPLNLGYRFKLSKYQAFELANSFKPLLQKTST